MPESDGPLTRSEVQMLERALRGGWNVPAERLDRERRRLQAAVDDPATYSRLRRRARIVLGMLANSEHC